MNSEAIRYWPNDHMMTPENSALAVIDCEQTQIDSLKSIDHDLQLDNTIGGFPTRTTSAKDR